MEYFDVWSVAHVSWGFIFLGMILLVRFVFAKMQLGSEYADVIALFITFLLHQIWEVYRTKHERRPQSAVNTFWSVVGTAVVYCFFAGLKVYYVKRSSRALVNMSTFKG